MQNCTTPKYSHLITSLRPRELLTRPLSSASSVQALKSSHSSRTATHGSGTMAQWRCGLVVSRVERNGRTMSVTMMCRNQQISWCIMVYYGILWYTMVYYGISWYIMVYYGIYLSKNRNIYIYTLYTRVGSGRTDCSGCSMNPFEVFFRVYPDI